VASPLQRAHPQPGRARAVLPGRLRTEVIIRTPAPLTSDLERPTPLEILTKTNSVAPAPAKAIRQLPSGDIALSFATAKAAEKCKETQTWVTEAFGPQATLKRPIFSLRIKGVPYSEGRPLAAAKEELATVNSIEIGKVFYRTGSRNPLPSTYGYAILQVFNPIEANRLIYDSLLFRGGLYDCERFLERYPTQCFSYWEFGHSAKACRQRKPRYKLYGAIHPREAGAEAECQAPPRCVNCRGDHGATSPDCPTRIQQQARAKEAYRTRARLFDTSSVPPSLPVLTTPSTGSGEGFTIVSRKRPRARGPSPERAQSLEPDSI